MYHPLRLYPIIGQPRVGEDWLLTIPLHCSCGQVFLLVGQVGATRPCPKCQRLYRLMGLPTANEAGGAEFPIGTALVTPPGDPKVW